MNSSSKHCLEYDVARVIVTVLVIVGHCTYYILGAPNEGVGYNALISPGLSGFYLLAQRGGGTLHLLNL